MTAFSIEDKIKSIRRSYLFAGASDDSLRPLAEACSVEKLPRKSTIFTIHDPADGLRIIYVGEVRIWLADSDGRELTLALLGPGDAFGEIALLDGLTRTASAVAERDVESLFLPAKAVERALGEDPALARDLIYSLCDLNRRNLESISSFAFSDLDIRLSKLLCDLAIDHANIKGNEAIFLRKFSQTDLALLLGVTREAINKRFKRLEQDGLVKVDKSILVLPAMQELSARAVRDV